MVYFKKVDYLTSEETGSWKPRPDTSQQEPPKPDADRQWATTDGGTEGTRSKSAQQSHLSHPCFRKPGDGPGDAALDLEGARAKISTRTGEFVQTAR